MEPTMALTMPPPTSPIGLGIWVKNVQLSPWIPRAITVPRIRNSGTVTKSIASEIKLRARRFVSRRCNAIFCEELSNGPRRHSPSDGPNQQAGERINDQSQHEQDECH